MQHLMELLKFDEKGLIPAIIADAYTNEPLTLCYMTREALEKTLETGLVHVFRRSKGRLMLKGEQSGHTQTVKGFAIDCEGKSVLIKVQQKVAACHTGYYTCYYREYDKDNDAILIRREKVFDPEKVY